MAGKVKSPEVAPSLRSIGWKASPPGIPYDPPVEVAGLRGIAVSLAATGVNLENDFNR
jgi:hypothetical protein